MSKFKTWFLLAFGTAGLSLACHTILDPLGTTTQATADGLLPDASVVPGTFQHNIVFLSRQHLYGRDGGLLDTRWMNDDGGVEAGDIGMLTTMRNRGITQLALNTANINPDGALDFSSGKGAVRLFLKNVEQWEAANPTLEPFKILAWINGAAWSTIDGGPTTDGSTATGCNSNKTSPIDAGPDADGGILTTPQCIWLEYVTGQDAAEPQAVNRATIAAQVSALTELCTTDCVNYAYDAGGATTTTRAFDGVLFDIEPTGLATGTTGSATFEGIKQTIIATRAAIAAVHDNDAAPYKIGFTPPKYKEEANPSYWTTSQYYYMGKYLDFIVPMLYDTAYTDAGQYNEWLGATDSGDAQSNQVALIIDSVSGYKTGAAEPTRLPQVYFGMSATQSFYHASSTHPIIHDALIENTQASSDAIMAAIQRRVAGDSTNRFTKYLGGAAVYVQNTGFPCSIVVASLEYCQAQSSSMPNGLKLYEDYYECTSNAGVYNSKICYHARQYDWDMWQQHWMGVY